MSQLTVNQRQDQLIKILIIFVLLFFYPSQSFPQKTFDVNKYVSDYSNKLTVNINTNFNEIKNYCKKLRSPEGRFYSDNITDYCAQINLEKVKQLKFEVDKVEKERVDKIEKERADKLKKIEDKETTNKILFFVITIILTLALIFYGRHIKQKKIKREFKEEEEKINDLFKINQGLALISAFEFYSKHKLENKFLEKYGDLHSKIIKFCDKIIEENNKENINLYKKVLGRIKELNDFMEQADKKAESFVKKYPYLKSLLKRV